MALVGDDERSRNRMLYDALMRGEADKVIHLCQLIQKGPLHTVTIHHDTVLHMATYSKQKSLVLRLLNMVPENQYHKLTCQNDIGNTILHEAATSDRIVPAAMDMLRKAPTLLSMPNRRGETALFRAARYGKNSMFFYLDEEVKKTVESEADFRTFHVRDDKTNILHISILTEHFDMALQIAEKYTYLASERDGDGMTALQLLACNPSAFGSGSNRRSFFKQFTYSRVSTGGISATQEEVERCCRVPLFDNIRDKKYRYQSALALAKFLIARDTSWEATESAIDKSKPKTHRYGKTSTAPQDQKMGQEISYVDIAEAPLFLATKSGCKEIVQEILHLYPQAVEHVDDEGRNILHVAIKYRKIEIFDIVEKMEIPMMRLIRKIDNNGNSILHMVGIKAAEVGDEDMRSPALILQEDLLLFERVRKISAAYSIKHYNSSGQTAERLFAENNAQIRMDAKEWMKGTAENCSIVAVLIATVAFAAAYTVPGGPNETGYPILEKHTFFIIFTMTDVLSLAFSLTSVIVFLSILTSPFRLKDFQQSLPQKLMMGVTLLILSVSMMMLAFAATVILMIRNKEKWTRIALYSVAFFPVSIFAASYLPLYMSLMKTFKYSLQKIGSVFPRCKTPSKVVDSRAAFHSTPTLSQANGFTDSIRPSAPPTNPLV